MHTLAQFRRYHRALWGVMLALVIAGLLSMQLATAVSADVSVNIMNFKFDPTPLTIPVGTTVVWTNQDTAPHTATSDPGSAFTFDTGMLQKGQSGKVTFTKPGTYTYFCAVHPNMHGTVVVTASGSGSTTSAASPSAATSGSTTSGSTTSGSTTGGSTSSGATTSTTNTTSAPSVAPTVAPTAVPTVAAPVAPVPSGPLPGFIRRLGDG